MTDVLKEALALKEYCTGCRRTVHQNPELSFQEFQTTAVSLAQPTPADMMVMWPSCWA